MIGYFHNVQELQAWAQQIGEQALEEYAAGGTMISLGYGLAMLDVAQSEVSEDVVVPPHQANLFDGGAGAERAA